MRLLAHYTDFMIPMIIVFTALLLLLVRVFTLNRYRKTIKKAKERGDYLENDAIGHGRFVISVARQFGGGYGKEFTCSVNKDRILALAPSIGKPEEFLFDSQIIADIEIKERLNNVLAIIHTPLRKAPYQLLIKQLKGFSTVSEIASALFELKQSIINRESEGQAKGQE